MLSQLLNGRNGDLSEQELQEALEYAKRTPATKKGGKVTIRRGGFSCSAKEWEARMTAARERLRRRLGLPPERMTDIPYECHDTK